MGEGGLNSYKVLFKNNSNVFVLFYFILIKNKWKNVLLKLICFLIILIFYLILVIIVFLCVKFCFFNEFY